MGFANSDAPPPSWAQVRPATPGPADPAQLLAEAERLAGTRGAPAPGRSGHTARSRPSTRSGPSARSGRSGATPPPPDSASEGIEPDAHDVARQIVLRQLTNSPKSRSQLAEALAKRNCDPGVAAAVLDRMEQVGLVDDEAYAGMFVRSQQAGRGLARRALAQQLRQKGIDDETAETVLDEVDPAGEEERARELVAKRLRRLHGLDPVVQTRRLAGMLARKGYPSDVTMRVIREALAEADEHQRD